MALAVRVRQAADNVKRAAALLGLDWDGVRRILERAVERGLERRSLDEVRHVGIDEKSFRRGHDYLSLLTDLSGAHVLEVSEGREQSAADQLWAALPAEQLAQVEAARLTTRVMCDTPGADSVAINLLLPSRSPRLIVPL